ncbi:MAG: glycoside hydrolase family 9 protein [Spirochaetales bacterium]|nr:glycoside hydrolase family 9 protein [Spirochaetales bacterium]
MSKWKQKIMILFLFFLALYSFGQDYNDALAKAIYFYEAQQAGPLAEWNRVEWRGDATMADDVLGGWYDAGDHVKFNLPMAYSVSQMGWGAYEFGSNEDLDRNLQFALDYLASCWDGNNYTYQIGDGNADHSWWGPVEVIHLEMQAGKRPSYSASSGLGTVMAQTAAALAIGNILYGNSAYLTKAKELYARAKSSPGDSNYTAALNFYTSHSGSTDELQWAAIWLYTATKQASYLSDAESYVDKLNRQGQTDEVEYKWGHCWDDVHYGGMLLLAKLTGKQIYKDFAHQHLDWWVAGSTGNTPDGLAWLMEWGALRHATTSAFLALSYANWDEGDAAKKTSYANWAKKQIDYALGVNGRNSSYVIGYGRNAPQHPHHRTSHGSWLDKQDVPANHRHVLFGALVGGPDKTGNYTDSIGDYVKNEVACDYNAGFVASLLALGNPSEATFSPSPEKKDVEFFAEAKLNSQGPHYTEYKVLINNQSGWPARTIKDLRFRIYFNISEFAAAGYGPEDITVSTNYVEFPITMSAVKQFKGNDYYIECAFENGENIYPGGQSEFSAETQIRILAPNNTTFWDQENDWSFKGLNATDAVATENITMFDGTTQIWGVQPDGTGPGETTPPDNTPTPTPPPVADLGDVDHSGVVNIVDALLIAKAYVNQTVDNYDETLADVNCDGKVNIVDALLVAQYYVNIIDHFC